MPTDNGGLNKEERELFWLVAIIMLMLGMFV
jgi:hypothetical protein